MSTKIMAITLAASAVDALNLEGKNDKYNFCDEYMYYSDHRCTGACPGLMQGPGAATVASETTGTINSFCGFGGKEYHKNCKECVRSDGWLVGGGIICPTNDTCNSENFKARSRNAQHLETAIEESKCTKNGYDYDQECDDAAVDEYCAHCQIYTNCDALTERFGYHPIPNCKALCKDSSKDMRKKWQADTFIKDYIDARRLVCKKTRKQRNIIRSQF